MGFRKMRTQIEQCVAQHGLGGNEDEKQALYVSISD
jgi:hypothetical protein